MICPSLLVNCQTGHGAEQGGPPAPARLPVLRVFSPKGLRSGSRAALTMMATPYSAMLLSVWLTLLSIARNWLFQAQQDRGGPVSGRAAHQVRPVFRAAPCAVGLYPGWRASLFIAARASPHLPPSSGPVSCAKLDLFRRFRSASDG